MSIAAGVGCQEGRYHDVAGIHSYGTVGRVEGAAVA